MAASSFGNIDVNNRERLHLVAFARLNGYLLIRTDIVVLRLGDAYIGANLVNDSSKALDPSN